MKKIISTILVLCFILTLSACENADVNEVSASKDVESIKAVASAKPQQVVEENTVVTVKASTDLVKEKKMYLPNTEYDVITTLNEGDEAVLLEQGIEWHKVDFDGQEGYILAMNVEGIEPLSSPYYIYIEKSSHTINIYELDEKGEYSKLIKTFLTATGVTAGKTPTGVFSVFEKHEWKQFDSAGTERQYSYSPYVVQFMDGIYIHGPVFPEEKFDRMFGDTYKEIGTNSTAGCMRTYTGAAYWIYNNCPMGTTVEIVLSSDPPRGIEQPELIKAKHDIEKGRYYDLTDPASENPVDPSSK